MAKSTASKGREIAHAQHAAHIGLVGMDFRNPSVPFLAQAFHPHDVEDVATYARPARPA